MNTAKDLERELMKELQKRRDKARARVEQLERWRSLAHESRGSDVDAREALRELQEQLLEAWIDAGRELTKLETGGRP